MKTKQQRPLRQTEPPPPPKNLEPPASSVRGNKLTPTAPDRASDFECGWRVCASWAKRDDLLADIGSPAYVEERDAALK
jgi:hypothetical protein